MNDSAKCDVTTTVEIIETVPRVSLFARQAMQNALRGFDGKQCRIRIEPARRSLDQNRYMHAIFSRIAEFMYDAGHSHEGRKISGDDWKLWYKKKYGLTRPTLSPDGETGTELVTTAKYNKKQMTEFIEKIRSDDLIVASEMYILTPEDYKRGLR